MSERGSEELERGTGNRGTGNRGTASPAAPPKGGKPPHSGQGNPGPAKPPARQERPLTTKERGLVDYAESNRKVALRLALGILVDFARRVTLGDASVWGKDPYGKKLSKQDTYTVRALVEVGLSPTSFDWLNNNSAKTMLNTVNAVIKLFIQNAQRSQRHVFFPQPLNDPTVAAQATVPMRIFPRFFEPWNDNLGPVLAITHEYFHYLSVPGTRQRVEHGLTYVASGWDSALANAYALSQLAMRLAYNRIVNGR